jgi:hypothetical protein
MPKKKKLQVKNNSILDWCNEQHFEGRELTLKWEGGGDSGWVYFELDGETVENQYTEALVNRMYDELDYGSWAGEFSANGCATYDRGEQAFVGTDYYSEDSDMKWKCEVVIKVPKDLWFDTLELNIEGDEPTVDVLFTVRNGFLSASHTTLLKDLSSDIRDKVSDEIDSFIKDSGEEFRGMWSDLSINRREFVENGDYLEYTISSLTMGTFDTHDKHICLEISHLTEPITED